MKHTTRILALLLALVLCLGLSVTAFATEAETAATGNCSITVENAKKDQTYKLYKMLNLSVSEDNTAYSYTVNDAWNNFFTGTGNGLKYVTITEGFVTWKTDADPAAFAKDAEAFVKNSSLTATASKDTTEADTNVVFSNLEPGYYLVTSSMGTKATVGTTPTNQTQTIQEKNVAPENDKKVEENSEIGVNDAYGKTNDATIGETVHFQSTITAQAGAENYVFHDTMDTGLTFDANSVKVELHQNGSTSTVATTNYTVKTKQANSEDVTDNCTFEVEFKQAFCDTLKAGDKIVISYSATLNASAVIGNNGNKNKSHITYGEKNTATPDSETTTKTWEVKVLKYTMKDNVETGLENAVFELKKSEDTAAEAIKLVKVRETNTYRVAMTTETDTVTTITTPASGEFTIQGLDSGNYWLYEKKAPAGYNELKKPVKIVIAENGNVTVNEETVSVDKVKVENNTGALLPSTGGMGTTIFYVLGGILAVGAAVLLVTKKRMERI